MRIDTHPTASNWEIRGKHVAVFFMLFFGTIFTVNFTMAALANHSWTGLIAKNGYVASKDLAVAHRKRRLALAVGWTLDISVDDDEVVLDFDGVSKAATGPTVTVIAERPLNEDKDIVLTMVRSGTNVWRSKESLPDGRWTIVATMASGPLELTERLSIEPGQRKAVLQ